MSSNIQEVREQVRQLKSELGELRAVTISTTTGLNTAVSLLVRLSGDSDISRVMSLMRRSIVVANQLRIALYAVLAARMAAGDPIAWIQAGVAVGTAAALTGELAYDATRGK